MNNLNTMAKKAEELREHLLECAKGYEERNKELGLHIKHLENFMSQKGSNNGGEVFEEICLFLREEEQQYTQTVKILNSIVDFLNSIITLTEEEKNVYYKGTHVLDVQEKERDRIARELHDSTVQDLTGLIYKVELCSKFLDKDLTKVRLEQQLIICSLKKVIDEMRIIIHDLKPMDMGERDLDDSIKKYVNRLAITYNQICIKYRIVGNKRSIKDVCKSALLRIVQEACRNAIKHSGAKCIDISLCFFDSKISLSVKDNGIGFDVDSVNKGEKSCEHFGLAIMKERAELMGAKFNISSIEKKGTIITVELKDICSNEGDKNGTN